MKRITLAVLALLATASCTDQPLDPAAGDPDLHFRGGGDQTAWGLRVMTRNVYVGANVDVVLAAEDPTQVPVLVAQAFQELIATNFPERAQAIASEISRTKPHLVGLQEISTVRVQSPGDAVIGGTTPAETIVFDYLAILLAALEAQGEHYVVAGLVQNADVEVPMIVSTDPLAFDDVRLTDFDVVLARENVEITNVDAQNYDVGLPIADLGITIPRGYVALHARVGPRKYRFVNTHLEPASIPEILPVQLAQASQLISMLAGETLPIVLVGDLNTYAPTGETYQMLSSAGYVDAWTSQPRRGEGFTCCHDPDLSNDLVEFDRRIDLIMARSHSNRIEAPFMRILGDDQQDRTSSGLWPSDHAGVWATLRFGSRWSHHWTPTER